jgi:hypothetical protein
MHHNGNKRWRISDLKWTFNGAGNFAFAVDNAKDIVDAINGSTGRDSAIRNFTSGIKGAVKAVAGINARGNLPVEQVDSIGIGGALKGAASGFANSAVFGGYNKYRKAVADKAINGLNQINSAAMNSSKGAHMIMVFQSQTCVCVKRDFWWDSKSWQPTPPITTTIRVYFPDGEDITTDGEEDFGSGIKTSDPGGSKAFSDISPDDELEGVATGITEFLTNYY